MADRTDDLIHLFGGQTLCQHVEELVQKLSQVLPQAVDKMTPNGSIPKG